jgi:fibronectin type 3 domain-containing protein
MKIINSLVQTLSSSLIPSRLIVGLALLGLASMSHASAPFGGTPSAIPGSIEAEDYDTGGEGDAYHDVDAGNNGNGTHRTDDVDHEVCTDIGGGFNVGWTQPGEWLKYTVNVASNGSYAITTRVASLVATGAFHIEINDVDVTGPISVGATGGWQSWQDTMSTVTLFAGPQVFKLVMEGPDLNINRFDITYLGPPPANPTSLQVDSTGTNSVSLSWTAPATGTPTGYNVKRATSSNGTYTVVGTTTAPTVAFMDSVTGGSTYYYVVSALTAGGESAESTFVSAMPILGVPNAPAGLAATPSDNQVALSWTASTVGSATSYNVLRSTAPGGPYTNIIATTIAPTTSHNDTTAVNDTTYYYVVSGENAIGTGANSSEVSATPVVFTGIYEPFDYPVEDNLLDGTPSTATGFGIWTNGVAGWVLSGLSYPDLPTANHAMRSPAGRQSVSIDTPLSSGTKWISYLWNHSPGDPGGNKNGVYFKNGGEGLYFGWGWLGGTGTEAYLGLGSINTVGNAVQSASLLTKTGLKYVYGGTKLIVLKIDFDTSGTNDTVTVYVNPTANMNAPDGTAAAVYTDFDVGTISGIGMQVAGGGDFITDEIRIADTYTDVVDAVVIPPNTPTGLNATAGTNAVSLSWTAATGGAPTGYKVKRSLSSGGPFATVASTTAPTVTYNDSVLGGSTYYYVVSAVNGIGESTNSAYVSAAPILVPPVTPTGFSSTPGDSEVTLNWAASEFATSYEVKRSTEIGGPFTLVGTTSDLTFDDTTGLTNAVTYYYVIAAIGLGGSSVDSSPPISVTPFGPLPLVLDIDPGVGITWFASNSLTYQVQWAIEDLGTNTVWNNLDAPIFGDGTTNTVFDPAAAPEDIYQVISF